MSRVVFILSFIALIAFYIVWGVLGYAFGSILTVAGTVVLIYLRRRYLGMRPYWVGRLADIPQYFKLP